MPDKFGFTDEKDGMEEFFRYHPSPEKDTQPTITTITKVQGRRIIELLELLVRASETELVSLKFNSGLQILPNAITIVPDITNVTPTTGYTRIVVWDIVHRKSPELYFSCEGPGTIYVRVSDNGKDFSESEDTVFEGEVRTYYDVYELRIRASTANTKYRITEYEPFKQRDFIYKTGLSYVSETNVAVPGTPNTENIVTNIVNGLGRFATTGYIINDGPGNLQMQVSIDGINYGTPITVITNQIIIFEEELYSLRIDATIAGTSYRLNVH